MPLWSKLSALLRRRKFEREMAEEIRLHLEQRTAENVAAGLSPADARNAALRRFGGVEQVKERARELRAFWGESWLRDLRIALRGLRRAPGFATICVLTLALGIGANLAIFSAFDAALLRPAPFPDSERIVTLFEVLDTGSLNSASGGAVLDWREHSRSFEAVALWNFVTANLRLDGTTRRLRGIEVSHEFLRVFGLRPLAGRDFHPEEDRAGGPDAVVMITEELWRSQFGADPAVVNRTILLDDVPRTVIGILPARAWMFRETQFLVPAVLAPGSSRAARTDHWAEVNARLKPGISVEQADAELKALRARLAPLYPAWKKDWNVAVRSLRSQLAGNPRPVLLTLCAAVTLLLLVACANVANLLLARASDRAREAAVRSALGASGAQLVRQVLSESLMIAVGGGAIGIGLAYAGVAVLQRAFEHFLPNAITLQIDLRLLGAAGALVLLTGLLCGLLPAWRLRRADLNAVLKSGGRGASGTGHRAQSSLVILEVALTLVLLVGAGLLLRSLWRAAQADPGVTAGNVVMFDLSLPAATYRHHAARLAFAQELLTRLRALPGVESAGAGRGLPFAGGSFGEYLQRVGDSGPDERLLGRMNFVSEGYFEAAGARLREGRWFDAADNRLGGPRVTVIDGTAARTLFPRGGAIGQRVTIGGGEWEVIGVVAPLVEHGIDARPRAFGYVPLAFNPSSFGVMVRASLPPEAMLATLRAEVQRLDAGVAIDSVRTMDEAMAASFTARRMVRNLVGAFAATSLLLASIGLYGVMSYSVATRRREFGVRLALGATPRAIRALVLRRGARLALAGVIAGLAGAFAGTRLIASLLYGVSAQDPAVFGGAIVGLASVALLACWLPAWRAARADPWSALRSE